MFKRLLYIVTLISVVTVFTSCSDDEPVRATSSMSASVNGTSSSTKSVSGSSQTYFQITGNLGNDVIKISTSNPAKVGTYTLGNPSAVHFAEISRGTKTYKTNNSGQLVITTAENNGNAVKRMIGSFNFTAYNSTDSLVVRNGKIDFYY